MDRLQRESKIVTKIMHGKSIAPHVCTRLTKFVQQILNWESFVIHLVMKLHS